MRVYLEGAVTAEEGNSSSMEDLVAEGVLSDLTPGIFSHLLLIIPLKFSGKCQKLVESLESKQMPPPKTLSLFKTSFVPCVFRVCCKLGRMCACRKLCRVAVYVEVYAGGDL